MINYIYDDRPLEDPIPVLEPDMVDSPPHYNSGQIECIDYLEDNLGEGFPYYCEGNVKKYLHRWRYKGGVEDLKKAAWYLDRLIKSLDNEVRAML